MTKERIRLTYRLTGDLYDKISNRAKEKGITVNAEINSVLWDYYNNMDKEGGQDERRTV